MFRKSSFRILPWVLWLALGVVAPDAVARVVRMGVFDHPPLSTLGPENQAGGIFVELLQEVAQAEGWELTYRAGSLQELMTELERGRIDILGPFTPSESRKTRFSFSDETVVSTWAQIYTAADLRIRSLGELDGLRVVGLRGDIHFDALKQQAERLSLTPEYLSAASDREAFELVARGDADALVTEFFATEIREKGFSLNRAPVYFFPHPIVYGAPLGENLDLLAAIDRYLKIGRSDSDSRYFAIINRRLGPGYAATVQDLTEPSPEGFLHGLPPQARGWLETHPELWLQTESEMPPFQFVDDQGVVRGVLADYIQALERRLQVRIHLLPPSAAAADSEKALLFGFTPLDRRDEPAGILQTEPILNAYVSLFARGEPPEDITPETLRGRTLVHLPGIAPGPLEMLKRYNRLVRAQTPSQALGLLLEGEADYYLARSETAKHQLRRSQLSGIVEAYTWPLPQEMGFLADPREPLLQWIINQAATEIARHELPDILNQWYGGQPVPRLNLSPEEKAWLRSNPVVRLAVSPDRAPLEFLDDRGELQGIAGDYLRHLQRLTGLRFELVSDLSRSEIPAALAAGRVDLATSLHRTTEPAPAVRFSDAYLSVRINIFTGPEVSYLGSLRELEGQPTAVVAGDASETLLRRYHPKIELVSAPDVRAALEMLDRGEATAYVGDLLTASPILSAPGFSRLRVAGETPYRSESAFASGNHAPLLVGLINRTLNALPERERTAIRRRWSGASYSMGMDYAMVWKILAGGLALFLVFLAWNRRLAQEVEARKRAELELRGKQRQLRQLVEDVGDEYVHFSTDSEHRVTFVSSSAAGWFGRPVERLTGAPWGEIAAWTRDSVETAGAALAVCQGGFTPEPHVLTFLRDGQRQLLEISIRPVFGEPDGALLRIDGIAHDITRQKHAEEALERARESAEAANRSKSAFLANMSHELRTPLNAILGFSQLMTGDRRIPADQQRSLASINRAGTHLLEMINEILDLSKIEAGRMELHPEPFDLRETLEDLAEMFELRARQKGLVFALDLRPELPRHAECDHRKLRQILINLLGNGLKFTESGSLALHAGTVPSGDSTKPRACQLVIDVEDTGIGVPEAQQERIFSPFVQAVAQTANLKGTGLGLSISRTLAKLMGGELDWVSKSGPGSCFRLRIPLKALPDSTVKAPRKTPPELPNLAPGSPSHRILVADDDPANRALMRSLLRKAGFTEVREARDGAEAKAAFEEFAPDLIWMDIRMPVLDGYQAARAIRALPGGARVKIVAVTAGAFNEQRAEILAAGFDGFLAKPFQAQELFDALAEQLGVRFQTPARAEDDRPRELDAAALATLPPESFAQLRRAVLALDTDELLRLAGQLHSERPEIAAPLRRLAEQYDFDRLLSLVEE